MPADTINAQDKKKRTALHYAVRRRYKAVDDAVAIANKLLDKGADPMKKTERGRTPAHKAAFDGNTEYENSPVADLGIEKGGFQMQMRAKLARIFLRPRPF